MQMEFMLNLKMKDGTPVPSRILSSITAAPTP